MEPIKKLEKQVLKRQKFIYLFAALKKNKKTFREEILVDMAMQQTNYKY